MSKKVLSLLIAVVLAAVATVVLVRGRKALEPKETKPVSISIRMPIPVVDTAFSPYYVAVDKPN